MTDFDSIDEFWRKATGHPPYDYQRRIAAKGLPELLAVPTGSGKTAAGVLPWLYRRRFHPEREVRAATPRRLCFVLPMRVLVEQTVGGVESWLERLGLAGEVDCVSLLGGEPRTSPWRLRLDSDMVVVGTLDMVLSRALNRGYGESRYLWPIDFGLLNNDCHFVFDEVQLMGPALGTSRQLHGLRAAIGEAIPCGSTWMSATVNRDALLTVDAPTLTEGLELSVADRAGPLAGRLDATKTMRRLDVDPAKFAADIADAVNARHRPGELTIVILNTVDRAREVMRHLGKVTAAELVLLHSRFRPGDRKEAAEAALAEVDPGGKGRIVVSTQVIEAGVDISASVLVTECAPWPSIVQRAGRCNRDGRSMAAEVWWVPPPKHEPYHAVDVAASASELEALEGHAVTPALLGQRTVAVVEEIHPVLRRKDLLDLFDTLPDLTGNDIDVARFIRKSDDLDVSVAWRDIGVGGVAADATIPGRDERCPVPVSEFRAFLREAAAWRHDPLSGTWSSVAKLSQERGRELVRPGQVWLLDTSSGGYSADRGWDPKQKARVVPANSPSLAPDNDDDFGADPASLAGYWVPLSQHLAETRSAASSIVGAVGLTGSAPDMAAAVVRAAELHDIGKAHPVFQASMRRISEPPDALEVYAKTDRQGRLRHGAAERHRRHFRHELASALALLGEGAVALDGLGEPDLVVYLVAAHHGRIRVGLRSMPEESPVAGRDVAMGVVDGDEIPAIATPIGELPASVLDLTVMRLGDRRGRPSWSSRALTLRDRRDLGVFRLGFLEALVRVADWQASALHTVEDRRA